jgi:hypothetical protein
MEWITWVLTFLQVVISLLAGLVLFFTKRWINRVDKILDRNGGVATLEDIEKFYEKHIDSCPAVSNIKVLCEWRDATLDKGGILNRTEHSQMCKEVTKDVLAYFDKRIGELFNSHKEWMAQELRVIRTEINSISKSNHSK